ncbi:MAG: K(+)-transporting ATPase subunit C [Chitinophagaceae bacterium]|nr:K(+)-transporting ATPase subunit C [Chitinophagaceae bacterium]
MKQYILPAIRLTLVSILVFTVLYTAIIWAIAQAGPNSGKGETVAVGDKVVGYKLEGQSFTADNYFNSRPSAVGYNAAGSGGSNKGPSNPDYLKTVQERVDTFLVHNPSVKKEEIPSELVTASGSGLDPNISVPGANVQVQRIAKARGIGEEKVRALIEKHTEQPLAGMFGTTKINVLLLNIDLDQIK